MNTKRLIFCAVTVLCSLSGFAQRKQTTEECTVHLDGIAFGGKMTYGYIVDEDGEHIRDGALSIIVNNRENSFYENDYRNFKLVGNYKLNANFQKGLLHGPMTMNANFKGDVRNYLERKQGSLTWSFQGNFANGLPHGNFNIQYNGETPRKLIATFNKGVLVGQIKCLYLDKGIYSEGNYSMNSKGELHGKSGSMEFINGVLVNKTSSGKSTPPRLVELAKKYANKTITEEELMKQDIIVLEDHIDLEKVIYDVIIESGLIDFENHIKRWDFTTPNVKKYKYLKKVPIITDAGVDMLIRQRIEMINNPDNENKMIWITHPNRTVEFNDKSLAAIYTRNNSNTFNNPYELYLTTAQLERIKSEIYTARIRKIQQLFPARYPNLAKFLSTDNSHAEGISISDNYKKEDSSDIKIIEEAKRFLAQRNLSGIDLIPSESALDSSYYVIKQSSEHEPDHLVFLEVYNASYEYINKEYYHKILAISGNGDALKEIIGEEKSKEYEALEEWYKKTLKQEELKALTLLFKPALDYCLNKKAIDIVYGETPELYFNHVSSDAYSRSYFNRKIKPFCVIVNYEIVEIRENEVVINLTKRISKKKGNMVYQVTWPYEIIHGDYSHSPKSIRIKIEGIDINNAQIISEGIK